MQQNLRSKLAVSALALLLLTNAACAQDTALPAPPAPADLVATDGKTTPAIPPVDGGSVAASMIGANDALANFGPSSGTEIGNRAIELRNEVLRLRGAVNANASEFMTLRANGAAGAVQYHSTVAAITARLQNGTTRGNPILLRQWEEAEASLSEVTQSLSRLNTLSTAVANDASLSAFLLESVQAAFQLSGAVDEDHDQLALLRDEVSRVIVQVDYLRNEITNDIQRQTTYLTTERGNLQALAYAINRGEMLGASLGNRPVLVNAAPVMSLPPVGGAPAAVPVAPVTKGAIGPQSSLNQNLTASSALAMQAPADVAGITPTVGIAPSTGKLLVLVRFNQENVDYEKQLTQAVTTTLDRRPNAEFTVVAVSPTSGDSEKIARGAEVAGRNAEAVKRALLQMGMAPGKISVANTQGPGAQDPEVHVYVR